MTERLTLHDVDDAAAFCPAIVAGSGLSLTWHDRDDLEQYLLVEAWRLSERYEPGGISFSTWARTTLRLRVVDWQRQRFGRSKWKFADVSYERPRPKIVSLDDGNDPGRLGGDDGTGSSDSAFGWDPSLGGLLRTGDRQQAQDLRALGLRPRR